MKQPTGLMLLAFLASCGDMEVGTEEEGPEAREDGVILDDADWDRLPNFDGHGQHGIGALYGRAVGQTSSGCSGFLIDDDVFVTANHCRAGNYIRATFGMYGHWGYSQARNTEARVRLQSLGIPGATVLASEPVWTQWICRLIGQEYQNRDVDYYRCEPNGIRWTEGAGSNRRSITFGLKPGHVWGHYNVETATKPEGRTVQAVSVNRLCGESEHHVLLSPGDIDDSHETCSGSYNHCFDSTTDWVAGSSGGAIFDTTTRRAFGVVQGHSWWWFGDPNDPCEDWSAAENMGTYLGARALAFGEEDADGGGWPLGSYNGWTRWVGGRGGSEADLLCPDGMLVQGVIGSNSAGQNGDAEFWAGNLGLVCVPVNHTHKYRLDRARVLASGSRDVGYYQTAYRGDDFNTYIHEVLSTSPKANMNGIQSLALCPPTYYVTGINVRAGWWLDKVVDLECREYLGPKTTTRTLNPINNVGTSSGGSLQSAQCTAGSYFAGIRVKSGWYTDGFRGRCRNPI